MGPELMNFKIHLSLDSSHQNSTRGVLGLFDPPLSNIVYLVIFPNLESYYYCTPQQFNTSFQTELAYGNFKNK